ncbi:MAG: hypothetical protein GDA43_05880 [Hormoscilla sp. SP5CHS1]|nr:hypothetical protein [Hormoscilla sp. SP12CHS1]MBC6452783.1 hypothetical protein [Hormoscilla sp. SP5CHS1]
MVSGSTDRDRPQHNRSIRAHPETACEKGKRQTIELGGAKFTCQQTGWRSPTNPQQ